MAWHPSSGRNSSIFSQLSIHSPLPFYKDRLSKKKGGIRKLLDLFWPRSFTDELYNLLIKHNWSLQSTQYDQVWNYKILKHWIRWETLQSWLQNLTLTVSILIYFNNGEVPCVSQFGLCLCLPAAPDIRYSLAKEVEFYLLTPNSLHHPWSK